MHHRKDLRSVPLRAPIKDPWKRSIKRAVITRSGDMTEPESQSDEEKAMELRSAAVESPQDAACPVLQSCDDSLGKTASTLT
jgi:hypothetical protein